MSRFSVVICGGGVAGLEAMLRLRRLAGDLVDLTLVSPDAQLAYRPLAVLQPFGLGGMQTVPVAPIVADTAATWLRDRLSWLDIPTRKVHLESGETLRYDAVLLAIGGRRVSFSEGSLVFTERRIDSYRDITDRLARGQSQTIVFSVPRGPTWPLPLYELALLTRRQATEGGSNPDISICDPGRRPLAAFGKEAGDAVTKLLDDAGITVRTGCTAEPIDEHWARLSPSGARIRADHVVTLPRISGPNVRGLPGDALDRYVAVDAYCRVKGGDGRIFGAGDATQLAVKHGSLSAQQADCAAAGIAHLAGASQPPEPFRPVVHGCLLTGETPLYITATLAGQDGFRSQIHDHPPWPAALKIVAEELSAYLEPAAAADR